MENAYRQRRFLRKLEAAWARFEILVNRATTSDFNPFYHLGTLGIYLLIVLTVTGIYLTLIYRPGAEAAYATVEKISANGFGSLMRSVHRYASDAFLLVTMVHALKILISDRFWGSRWLAWVTGWLMVIVGWVIGTMGYWLIWDVRSQWMTEVLYNNAGGGIALTFLNPNMASSSFAAFVVVLFLHIFLPLSFLLLIVLHILRLARGRLWSPRWVMVLAGLALVIVSVFRPAMSEAPADLNRFIMSAQLDAWYLGFLPLLERMGNGWFSALVVGVLGASIALPWLAKGQNSGPAFIEEAECTGCGLCAAECPYRAIEMHYRSDDTSRFKSIAVINPDLCTGCGLCVGTCATLGVELTRLPTDDVYKNGLRKAVQMHLDQGGEPVVIFTCERHAALGSLPESLNIRRWTDPGVKIMSPVFVGEWTENGRTSPSLTCVLPCIGMVDVDWIKELTRSGAGDVMMLGCPYDDCNYREGVLWESARLRRRKSLMVPELHWQEAAPGDKQAVPGLFAAADRPDNEKEKPELPDPKARQKLRPGLPAAGIVLAIFSFVIALALPVDFPARSRSAGESQLRLLVHHPGVVATHRGSENITLPENATVDLSQILSGVPYPVGMRLYVDSELVLEDVFEAAGIRGDGEIDGMSLYNLPPGEYRVEIQIQDDGTNWRTAFEETVVPAPSQILTFIYDREKDQFILSEP